MRPPTQSFRYSHLHHLSWQDVAAASTFDVVWGDILEHTRSCRFVAAHNAKFEQWVLGVLTSELRLPDVSLPWVCTQEVARRRLGLKRVGLAHVCAALGIPLSHHDALSDARACATILLRAR